MLGERYAADRILAQLDDPDHAWWVRTRRNPAMAGFAHAVLDGADCKLDKLYVHPDHQRQGIGATLLRAVQDWARKRQARRLWLQVNRQHPRPSPPTGNMVSASSNRACSTSATAS